MPKLGSSAAAVAPRLTHAQPKAPRPRPMASVWDLRLSNDPEDYALSEDGNKVVKGPEAWYDNPAYGREAITSGRRSFTLTPRTVGANLSSAQVHRQCVPLAQPSLTP